MAEPEQNQQNDGREMDAPDHEQALKEAVACESGIYGDALANLGDAYLDLRRGAEARVFRKFLEATRYDERFGLTLPGDSALAALLAHGEEVVARRTTRFGMTPPCTIMPGCRNAPPPTQTKLPDGTYEYGSSGPCQWDAKTGLCGGRMP